MKLQQTRRSCYTVLLAMIAFQSLAQDSFKQKYSSSTIFAGIEVGSKGVKMSILEVGKNAKTNGAFNILKDTSVNTDFISFTPSTSQATLAGLTGLYQTALKDYKIPAKRIYTVVSSGVKGQAEKDNQMNLVNELITSFKSKIKEPGREVEVVDVQQEARLSHLGIIPDARRYNTFLIDIGSGNAKGGYFPYGNTSQFRLFQLNWGTKSTANATEKRMEDTDKTIENYHRQLWRVLAAAENNELIYAINSSGAYPLSDHIAFSGGIAWAVATLLHPEAVGQSNISVSFQDVAKLCERLFKEYPSLSDTALVAAIQDPAERELARKEISRVHKVFDQRALMAGSGLLLKIMRQFAAVHESKQFVLIKNGQVGWISSYVDQTVED